MIVNIRQQPETTLSPLARPTNFLFYPIHSPSMLHASSYHHYEYRHHQGAASFSASRLRLSRRTSAAAEAEDTMEEENGRETNYTVLGTLLEQQDWAGVLSRIASHPEETHAIHQEGRRPLHLACADDAPAVVVQALLQANPEAATLVGTSGMTPLHLTVASEHASVHVVRVLLQLGGPQQCIMQDLDGDTVLHAACRSGAPKEVIEVLLRANPAAVHQRDYEGLTPLLRLWVRYVVTLGDDALENITTADQIFGTTSTDRSSSSTSASSDLDQAWQKTVLLLRCAHYGQLDELDHYNNSFRTTAGSSSSHNHEYHNQKFVVHAAAAVDCPRPVLGMVLRVWAEQLLERDVNGNTPLALAVAAPIFQVRDLSDKGYALEDVVHGGDDSSFSSSSTAAGGDTAAQSDLPTLGHPSSSMNSTEPSPSVVDLIVQACPAAVTLSNGRGQLPLHTALWTGKTWSQGVGALTEAFSEGLVVPEPSTGLPPCLLAAADLRHDRGSSSDTDLSTIYQVLRFHPAVLTDLVEGKTKIEKHTTCHNAIMGDPQRRVYTVQ
jgi:ankyrin repeat protein